MKIYQKLCFLIFAAVLTVSCVGEDLGALESKTVLNIPAHSSSLAVSSIRAKGFTVSWADLQGDFEYALAASYTGNIGTYEEALENNHIVVDFTPDSTLNGSCRVTGLIPGKDYEIKLFARRKNTRAAEFLKAGAALPYIDDAELLSVWFDDEEAFYDRREDSFTTIYLPMITDGRENRDEYTVTYRTARQCRLFDESGELLPEEFTLRAGESVIVAAVHERTEAARDYIIAIRPIDNGIPVVMIETENQRPVISRTDYIGAYVKILDSDTNPYNEGIFEGELIIRARGSLSAQRPKRSFIIRTEDSSNIQMLDMYPAEDWILLSNFTDKTLMRNYIAHELSRAMGAVFSPRFRFADLVVNGDYLGTYMLGERIKIDKGRLDLPKIRAEARERVKIDRLGREIPEIRPASTPEELTGSYIAELRSTSEYSNDEIIFETKRIRWSMGSYFRVRQPGPANLTEDSYNYIAQYVNDAEDALYSDDFKDPQIGYRAYFEVETFIDWYILNELFKRAESNFTDKIYFYKPRDGKLSMGPVWDFENAAGNISYGDCENPEGWHVRSAPWFMRLFLDEAFEREFKARWNAVKSSGMFDDMFALIDSTAELLERSQALNFTRWPIMGINIWPNDTGAASRRTYAEEVDYFKEWLTERIEWMDGEINKQ
ncbi:MAG: CotH kinase family protein [Oscillospiraceae bacterium]|nr:CotH kinase family protein [Oscillospiraceae bacterium]